MPPVLLAQLQFIPLHAQPRHTNSVAPIRGLHIFWTRIQSRFIAAVLLAGIVIDSRPRTQNTVSRLLLTAELKGGNFGGWIKPRPLFVTTLQIRFKSGVNGR